MLKKIFTRTGYLAAMLSLGFVIYYYLLSPAILQTSAKSDHSQLSTQALFSAKLPDEKGIHQALSQYKGKIIVLNFWATWCAPCREEMPELSKLHTDYQDKNVLVLGIAIDEPSLVNAFIQSTPVSYPLLVSEDEGMTLSSNLGNDQGILPYTLIINADGRVVKTLFGRINQQLLEATLIPLLIR